MDCAHAENRAALETSVRQRVPDAVIAWLFFENNVEKANQNCRRDPTRRDVSGNIAQNNAWSKAYDIPAAAEVLPIYELPEPAPNRSDPRSRSRGY
jgi:hypothetical protein